MFVQNNHGVGDMTDKRNSKLHFLPRGKYKRQKSAEYQVRSPSLESSGSAKTVKRKWRKQAQAAYDRTSDRSPTTLRGHDAAKHFRKLVLLAKHQLPTKLT